MNLESGLKIPESLVDDRLCSLAVFVLFCFLVSGRRRKVISVLQNIGSLGSHMFGIVVRVLYGIKRAGNVCTLAGLCQYAGSLESIFGNISELQVP